MIVWLNGTHGAGKTTTSALVQQLLPDARVFDAEKVGEVLMDSTDPEAIAAHPSIRAFDWFAEDVPDKTWAPIVDRVGRPKARALSASDWFDQNP